MQPLPDRTFNHIKAGTWEATMSNKKPLKSRAAFHRCAFYRFTWDADELLLNHPVTSQQDQCTYNSGHKTAKAKVTHGAKPNQ